LPSPIDKKLMNEIEQYTSENRFQYFLREAIKNSEVWLLTDEHGCMMLNSEDDDCVPVWPNEEFAQTWATGDWQSCKAEAISLDVWLSRWTNGLDEDELSVVVFPDHNEEGFVLYPNELAQELQKKLNKASR
jgi:hypothetical protein